MKYLIPLLVLLLTSCASSSYYQMNRYVPYQGYQYDDYNGYYGGENGNYNTQMQYYDNQESSQNSQISVPNSYHVGRYRSPAPPRSRDSSWVSRQNPGGYTIEVSRGAKASQVAKQLMRAPKNNRTAAVRSGNGYVGVYGSYSSYEDARRAYDQLPSDLKQNARIKSWGSVR